MQLYYFKLISRSQIFCIHFLFCKKKNINPQKTSRSIALRHRYTYISKSKRNAEPIIISLIRYYILFIVIKNILIHNTKEHNTLITNFLDIEKYNRYLLQTIVVGIVAERRLCCVYINIAILCVGQISDKDTARLSFNYIHI